VQTNVGLEKLWNEQEQSYQPLDLNTGKHVGGISSGSFVAFLPGIDDIQRARKLLDTLENWGQKGLLVPSFDPTHKDFEPQRYWMGPVWAVVNYMIYDGLKKSGYEDAARAIARDTSIAMLKNGFSEYFSSETAKGLGGEDFSWTSSMWLYWLEPIQDDLSSDYPARIKALRLDRI